MRSVRDLPSNVKVGEAKKEDGAGASDGSQLPDNKGDSHKGENEGKREPDSRSESESSKGRNITYRMEGEHKGTDYFENRCLMLSAHGFVGL